MPRTDNYTPILPLAICMLIALQCCCIPQQASAQGRQIISLSHNWQFAKAGAQFSATPAAWQLVQLPHTWNAQDVNDDEPGYYRGAATYRTTFSLPPGWDSLQVYLHFEGANQQAKLLVNGKAAGMHTGGYTAFRFNISSHLRQGINEVEVQLTNAHDSLIPPLSGDFSFYGGIYRGVQLVAVHPVHFDMDNLASQGVFFSTPVVNENAAQLHIRGKLKNAFSFRKKLCLAYRLCDSDGKQIIEKNINAVLKPGELFEFAHLMPAIKNPKLWSPASPYLYKASVTVLDAATGAELDRIDAPVGFRWFRFSADSGFFLNGKPLKLTGASRHQDYPGKGNALGDARHIADVQLLKDMGGNFLRIAHYPQDDAILQACDRLGILVSEEIPVVNTVTESIAFFDNSIRMQQEMIRQHYNHPSVILWGYMNEIMLGPKYQPNSPERKSYTAQVRRLAQMIDSTTRAEDNSRFTTMACHGAFDAYNNAGLLSIPQVIGWNLYNGWYSAGLENFEKFLDFHHRELPAKPFFISEYGADADMRLHSTNPVRFDKTIEYANIFHQVYFKSIMEKPFVAGAAIWNLAEFNAEHRQETTPHMNVKGITTATREPKDMYLFYQSHLLSRPFTRIGSRSWVFRAGLPDSNDANQSTQEVEVYSNMPSVKLNVNGKLVGTVHTTFNVARFKVPFVQGKNTMEVFAGTDTTLVADRVTVDNQIAPQIIDRSFSCLRVSLGDSRIYINGNPAIVWWPEQAFYPGSWGYEGGSVYKMKNRGRQSFGTDKAIAGTEDDAVYASQRNGIKTFRADVPQGRYEVRLHFARLDMAASLMPYNLDAETENNSAKEAVFNVLINKNPFLNEFGAAKDLPANKAIIISSFCQSENNGITVQFVPVQGDAFLNAIEIIKIF